ncbi:MAG: chorismate synthase [Candidatus Eremiobacteraeota bacterium]|nr:chorismate synthase [Candidatus Eremiobacteraeota bacterium]MBC5803925.1 chorismate synthase [Candidatus Eremiobacteraeota bacterium]MBC5820877.1 chorismate synthase [Candidatus Eremiobacteraeota bacterium]
MFRYLTAGESHGPALVGILDGLPAHLTVDVAAIDATLRARQGGYGRSARMAIESDAVEFLAGVRGGVTLGSPIAVLLRNRDFDNVRALMDPLTGTGAPLTRPRPGHADYAGALKYRQRDLRNVLERASARETAMRVALGAICAQFLQALGIRTTAYVSQIGPVVAAEPPRIDTAAIAASDVRCPDPQAQAQMIAAIDAAKAAGDTLGGAFTVRIDGLPAGIGANRQPDTRLDGVLAGALMAMQTVKAVEIGAGADIAGRRGSQAHDAFALQDADVVRSSNRAGGIEGGISNGEPIVLRASLKPIPTLRNALPSVDLHAKQPAPATIVRSDVCVVPAASLVGEAMVRLALTAPVLEKFGGDSLDETRDNMARAVAASARLFDAVPP